MHAPIPFADEGGTPAWRARQALPPFPLWRFLLAVPHCPPLAFLAAASWMCFQGVRDQRAL
ncbi:MAG: hypothetical protein WA864_10530 [Acetobacteraceae bacterium]